MAIGIISGINSKNKNNIQLTVSSNFISLGKNETTTVTISTPSDGNIYATSANTNIATASVNNNVITINTLAYGSTIIYIGQNTGTGDYSLATPEVIRLFVLVSLAGLGDTFNDSTWQAISTLSQEGSAATYWSVGDQKSIVLNGDIGDDFTADNLSLNVFILHINMPINNVADNNIILGGFKDSNGVDICLTNKIVADGVAMEQDNRKYFNYYHCYGSNAGNGSWKGCDFRYDILGVVETAPVNYLSKIQDYTMYSETRTTPTYEVIAHTGYDATSAAILNPKENTLMTALPNDFRSVLKLWDRYIAIFPTVTYYNPEVKTVGVTDLVSKCTDAGISLLAEYEVFGTIKYANPYEADHQVFLDYYATGNSAKKEPFYNAYVDTWDHSWPLISYRATQWEYHCRVAYNSASDTVNSSNIVNVTGVSGLAPAFKI